jgi:hypothetical protein
MTTGYRLPEAGKGKMTFSWLEFLFHLNLGNEITKNIIY